MLPQASCQPSAIPARLSALQGVEGVGDVERVGNRLAELGGACSSQPRLVVGGAGKLDPCKPSGSQGRHCVLQRRCRRLG